ncbi:hypothetical protein [Spirosoma rigui]|uniref:hypothetical protein n=1 Tax=Spirosoma rigui TaxID=564064 RepID=UPI0009B07FFA|nr:hypothetical protein [Spirosoma rigui]
MNRRVYSLFTKIALLLTVVVGTVGTVRGAVGHLPDHSVPVTAKTKKAGRYDKTLRFNVYSFNVSAADSANARQLTVKAYRGTLLLTNFKVQLDGSIINAEVGDLDKNGFPELYVYSMKANSLGRVHAWQFLADRKASITPVNWPLATDKAYMGQDSLWIDRASLCRKYPAYQVVNGKKVATGKTHWVRYRLKAVGSSFALVAEPRR